MRGRCTNCGKKCSDDYCCEVCHTEGEAYFKKLDSLNEAAIIIGILAYIVFMVIVAILAPKYMWPAFLPAGVFCLFWPYVNNDTMKIMSIRTAKLVLKLFGILIIVICIFGTVSAFQ